MKLPLMPQHHKGRQTAGPIQTIQRKLAQNALTEFKIGFEAEEFRSKRDVQSLIDTIRDKYLHKLAMDKISCLESIRIGWKLPRFAIGPILQEVVPMLLQKPAKVQHLQLNINSWVPLPTIERLISWHTLETLDLRSVRIRTRIMSEPRPSSADRGKSLCRQIPAVQASGSSGGSPLTSSINSVTDMSTLADEGYISVDDRILVALPYLSPSIKTLKLVDCDLQVEDMPDLMDILRQKRHVQSLSLRHNRRLFMNGWEQQLLVKLPFLKALDLSICDLSPFDGLRLASALNKNYSKLKSLNVAGNYRLNEAIPDLIHACATSGIVELDCSFCDVQNKCQQQVFQMLATLEPCSLQSLKMQAVRIKNVAPLIQCLETNTSLQRLILDHPREPYELSTHSMHQLLEAVRHNYYLQAFRVDPPYGMDPRVLEEMEYWMTLNKCGRSILVHDSSKHWPHVLANAANLGNVDMFYWILRNGAEQF